MRRLFVRAVSARLKIDATLGRVVSHQAPPKRTKARDLERARALLEKEAAQREAREETGLSGTIVTKIDTIKYSYVAKWEKPTIRVFKIVTFYLLKFTEGDPSQHDREVDRVEWFPIEKAITTATYPQEKTILRKAKDFIAANSEAET